MTSSCLQAVGLRRTYPDASGRRHTALHDVDLRLEPTESVALLGRSGCGKTTLLKALLLLDAPGPADSGAVLLDGDPVITGRRRPGARALRPYRRAVQYVPQDPAASLDPRYDVVSQITRALHTLRAPGGPDGHEAVAQSLLEALGLPRQSWRRRPHEISGGQAQRLALARALAPGPRYLLLDEPVSALDVCIQAQILNLLNDLQREFHYTYVFISHNLSVVKHVSDRIAVMYLGQVVELCDYKELFTTALHPYTQALLSAIPVAKLDVQKERIILEGDVPSPIEPPDACRFMGRCRYCQDICRRETPPLREHLSGHYVACHFAGNLKGGVPMPQLTISPDQLTPAPDPDTFLVEKEILPSPELPPRE